ncbi:MAG: PadR family transcriptional regulator [Proteobacteria bacterium]|nr:PadR family transcriptional regulator [Pseudomonadota bacterium]
MVERDNTGLGELRRGVLVLAVLSRLQVPQYGYSLKQALAEGGMPVEEGTLYPLLRRLEAQGLLASDWDTGSSPPRRYYRLSADGTRAFAALAEAWREQVRVIGAFLEDTP